MRRLMRRSIVWPFLAGIVLGIVVLLIVRFLTYNPGHVHYHANFAVFINGQQEPFKQDFYYEAEGAACTSAGDQTPQDRAHMHDHEAGLVHVHAHTVTWGAFLQNIGWVVNPRFINTPSQLLVADDTHKVTFILNGQTVPNIANMVIGDRDKLLIDYGNGTQSSLQQEEKAIPNTAAKEDTTQDPASCSGSTPVTTSERLHHLF